MATLYRVGPGRELALRLDGPAFDPAGHRLVLVVAGQGAELQVAGVGDQGWLRLTDHALAVERLLAARAGDTALDLWVVDASGANLLHSEPLACHPSFFVGLLDFAAAPLYGHADAAYPKPGLLAVFTHVHDDHEMLRLWVRHHARWLPPEHLHVIDHGSTVPCEPHPPGVQVVRIPRSVVDHGNIAQFCNQYQRFLLAQYRWVMHVDVDEWAVPADGFDGWLARLDAAGPSAQAVIRPRHAVDLVERPGVDAALDPSRPLGAQRSAIVANAEYVKPVLLGAPATWGPGFHFVMEDHRVVTDEHLWLIHLAKVDVDLALIRDRTWLARRQSSADQRVAPPSRRHATREDMVASIEALLASAQASALPDAIRALI